MRLSKIVKIITSISLAAALAISGINYQPAKAEAAALPVVTVLGATLSLDAEAGKQSMRVAIQVENADNASACGMSITYKGKKLVFSTNDGKNDKLYDADTNKKTVVYAVKIANIPSANFADNFIIEGFATPITGAEEGEKVTTEMPVEKSVNTVFEGIKEATGLDNLKFAADGSLVVEEEGFDVDITTAANNSNYTGSYVEETRSFKGTAINQLIFRMPKAIESGWSANITINGSTKLNAAVLRTYFSGEWGDGKAASGGGYAPGVTYSVSFGTPYTYVTNNSADYITIKMNGFTEGDEYEITGIRVDNIQKKVTTADIGDTKIDRSVKLDLSTVKSASTAKYYEDLKCIKSIKVQGTSFEMTIPLTFTVEPGESVKVTVNGSSWGDGSFRCWTVPSDDAGSGNYVTNNQLYYENSAKGEKYSKSLVLTAQGRTCDNITFKAGHGTAIDGLVIDEIIVEKIVE